MGQAIEFPANGRTCPGYLATPAEGTGKEVVVIQEWWGLNRNIRSIADRFAAEGFVALAPDLYHGNVTEEPDEAGKLMMALRIEEAEADLRGAIRYLKERTGAPVGTVGFCMGGALSLFAACKAGEDVGACVDFYGGHPAVSYEWDRLTAPVLGIWAEHDDFVNPNVPRFEEELRRRGKLFEFVTYAGTRHAFFNDERPETFHPQAAEDSWQRVVEFFRRHL